MFQVEYIIATLYSIFFENGPWWSFFSSKKCVATYNFEECGLWTTSKYYLAGHYYWTRLIDWPPVCTTRDLRKNPLGDRRDDACWIQHILELVETADGVAIAALVREIADSSCRSHLRSVAFVCIKIGEAHKFVWSTPQLIGYCPQPWRATYGELLGCFM